MSARSLTLAGVLCIIAACGGQADPPQPGRPEVDVMTVKPQSIMLTTEVPGRTSAFLQAEVRPQVSGTILQRRFDEGADVRAGQLLYQIDPLTYQVAFDFHASGRATGIICHAPIALLAAFPDAGKFNQALIAGNRAALVPLRTTTMA